MNPIQKLCIPQYITTVKLSNSRRRKYYRIVKGKWKPRKLPKTYGSKIDDGTYKVDRNGYLLDESGNKVLANPRAAGTPNYEHLSGNAIFTGYGSHHIRNKLVKEVKKFLTPYIKKLRPFTQDELPLHIQWDVHAPIGSGNWDVDNLFFYWKYIQDCLVDEGIIPDDNVQFITFPPSARFCPVESAEERKFELRFYKEPRTHVLEYYERLKETDDTF